jgi:hypothetical protein
MKASMGQDRSEALSFYHRSTQSSNCIGLFLSVYSGSSSLARSEGHQISANKAIYTDDTCQVQGMKPVDVESRLEGYSPRSLLKNPLLGENAP